MKDYSKIIKKLKELGLLTNSKMEPITDGIFDINTYKKQEIKILWILKEPYDEDENGNIGNGGWSITDSIMEVIRNNEIGKKDRRFIHDKHGAKTFQSMIRTSYRILHPEQKRKKVDIDKICGETIRSIAYINSSKMPGEKRTVMAELKKKAGVWTTIIKNQIEKFRPNIIIFGNTFSLYPTLFKTEELTCWSSSRNVKLNFYYDENRQRLYVDAYHPSYSGFSHKYENLIGQEVNKWIKKR